MAGRIDHDVPGLEVWSQESGPGSFGGTTDYARGMHVWDCGQERGCAGANLNLEVTVKNALFMYIRKRHQNFPGVETNSRVIETKSALLHLARIGHGGFTRTVDVVVQRATVVAVEGQVDVRGSLERELEGTQRSRLADGVQLVTPLHPSAGATPLFSLPKPLCKPTSSPIHAYVLDREKSKYL